MAEYQNLFTRVQVSAPSVGNNHDRARRSASALRDTTHWHWLGKIGDAQIGPIYLGWLGMASLICGFALVRDRRPEHVGLGQLGSGAVRPTAAVARARAAAAVLWPAHPAG